MALGYAISNLTNIDGFRIFLFFCLNGLSCAPLYSIAGTREESIDGSAEKKTTEKVELTIVLM